MDQQKLEDQPSNTRAESIGAISYDALEVVLQTTPLATVAINLDGLVIFWNPAARRMFGWKEEEVRGQPLQILSGDEQDIFCRHLHALVQGSPSESFETRMVRKDLSMIDTSVVVSPLHDPAGHVAGVMYQISDNTKRIRANQRRSTHYRVGEILSKAESLEEAAPQILRAICSGLDWGTGFLWMFDPALKCLVCTASYAQPAFANARLLSISARHRIQPGVSLVGQVWKTRKPAWIGGTNTHQPRLRYAVEVGLYGSYLFPVMSGNTVAGVFEFFNRKSRQPDPDLLQLLQAIGNQVGQYVARLQAEQHARHSRQESVTTLIESLHIGVVQSDRHGRILEANENFASLLGYRPDDFQQANLSWNDLLAPEDQTVAHHFMVRVFGPEGSRPDIYTLRDANGCPVRVLLAGHATPEEPHSVIACCLSLDRNGAGGTSEEGYREYVMQLLAQISRLST